MQLNKFLNLLSLMEAFTFLSIPTNTESKNQVNVCPHHKLIRKKKKKKLKQAPCCRKQMTLIYLNCYPIRSTLAKAISKTRPILREGSTADGQSSILRQFVWIQKNTWFTIQAILDIHNTRKRIKRYKNILNKYKSNSEKKKNSFLEIHQLLNSYTTSPKYDTTVGIATVVYSKQIFLSFFF